MTAASLLQALVLTVNGLPIGAGQDVRLQSITGLDDLPEVRTFDSPRANDSGTDFGTDLLSGRVVEVNAYGRLSDPAATLVLLRAALVETPGTMLITGMPGLPSLLLTGRVRRRKIPTDTDLIGGVIRPVFDFECEDPHLYAATETVLTTGPGSSSGSGITPPLTPPVTPGGSATGGHVQATNAGTRTARPIVRIDGPVTAFTLLNATTQRALSFSAPLASGEWLEFDMDARTVLLNGTASRRSLMSGAWWDLPPGLSDLYYLPADAAVGSLMTVRFRSAY